MIATFIPTFLPQFFEPYQEAARAPVGTRSTHERCIDAVIRTIKNLDLEDLHTASILKSKVPVTRRFQLKTGETGRVELPGVLVAPWGAEQISPQQGTNLRDDIGYPVVVVLIQSNTRTNVEQDQSIDLSRIMLWRQTIIKAFRNQPLSGVRSVMTCTVEPQSVIGLESFFRGFDVSSVVFRFFSRETRGV